MRPNALDTEWFDGIVAAVFATVAVLGTVAVVAALILHFPGSGGSSLPMP